MTSASMPNPGAVTPSPWRRAVVRTSSIALSIALIWLVYSSVDVRSVMQVLHDARPAWLIFSLAVIVPIAVARAMRFRWLVPSGNRPTLAEAIRLTVLATALNLFMPSKTGDFAKSAVMARRGDSTAGFAVSVVIYERLLDMVGLLLWCVGGVILAPPIAPLLPKATWLAVGLLGVLCAVLTLSEGAAGIPRWLIERLLPAGRSARMAAAVSGWPELLVSLRGMKYWLVVFSAVLWLCQLAQIWLFTVAISASIPFSACASLAAISLLVSQLPITFGGIGARDVALVLLLSAYMSTEQAAAVGLLITVRGFIVPLAALPFIRSYAASLALSHDR